MSMVRKQIYITADQDEKLKRLAAEWGQPEAEIVRAALDNFGSVTYDAGAGAAGRIREAAVMEYTTRDEVTAVRGAETSRSTLADRIWQEELNFIRSLDSGVRDRGAEGAWKFNREELYEERDSKILRRH